MLDPGKIVGYALGFVGFYSDVFVVHIWLTESQLFDSICIHKFMRAEVGDTVAVQKSRLTTFCCTVQQSVPCGRSFSPCLDFGVRWVFPKSVKKALFSWRGSFVGKERLELYPLCIFWTVWKEHNRIAFKRGL